MAVSLSGMSLYTDNDNESGWAGTDGPDTYNNAEQGSNSESWNVGKNTTETGTLTKSASLNSSRGLFVFLMASNLAPYYTSIDLELQSSAGNYKNFECANSANKAIAGVFVPTVVDYVNKGADVGTFLPGSLATSRIIVDNSSSGNIRAVINNWIDAMYYGVGHTVSGTTSSDALFAEAFAVDDLVANKYGILLEQGGIIFSQGDLDLAGTLTSKGETLVFLETVNGYSTYNLDITGTVVLENTSILEDGAVDYNFDSTAATSFSMIGGVFRGYLTLVNAAGQTMSGIVFQDGGTATISNTVSESPFNQCGVITITGTLDGCTINKSTATKATTAANTNKADGCHFIKDTSASHALELTGAAGDYAWNSTASGYDTGSTGNGVEVTGGSITGNEHIHITATTGTFNITVADGATVPSVSSAGAVVNVTANQITLQVTVLDDSTGLPLQYAHVWMGKDSDKSQLINGATDVNGEISTAIDYDADTDVVGWARQWDLSGTDYTPKDFSGQYTSAGFSITIRLSPI
ncbi:MAG: hypothetical protein RPU60_04035 [Candidatus Sedimenticola sp. (ex Thyasira tokunagai)]